VPLNAAGGAPILLGGHPHCEAASTIETPVLVLIPTYEMDQHNHVRAGQGTDSVVPQRPPPFVKATRTCGQPPAAANAVSVPVANGPGRPPRLSIFPESVPVRPPPYAHSIKVPVSTWEAADASSSRVERLQSICRGHKTSRIASVQLDSSGLCTVLTGLTPSKLKRLAEAVKVC
jgi:hypothetical protein